MKKNEKEDTIFDIVETFKSYDVGMLPKEKEIALQVVNLFYENKIKIARANVILDTCKEIIQYSTVGNFKSK